MPRLNSVAVGFTGMISLLSLSAHADSWRCGRQLVKIGDSPTAVIQRCGKPDWTQRGKARLKQSGKNRSVSTQRWTYSTGNTHKTLVFADGRLLEIEHHR